MRACTKACRSFADLYSAFSRRSPCSRAFSMICGSTTLSSCDRRPISSSIFSRIWSNIGKPSKKLKTLSQKNNTKTPLRGGRSGGHRSQVGYALIASEGRPERVGRALPDASASGYPTRLLNHRFHPFEDLAHGTRILGHHVHVAELPARLGRFVVEVQAHARNRQQLLGRRHRSDQVEHPRVSA